MTREREGEIMMVVLAVLESWFPILSIVAMKEIGAMHTYAYALLVSLFFFGAIMIRRGLFKELYDPASYKYLFLTSFWITTLFVFVFLGMQYTTAGNMSVIIFLQLFFAYLYFNVFGSEKMDRIHSFGAFLMGIGALLILVPDNMQLNKGDMLIMIGAAIAPIANYYSKKTRDYCSSETILGVRTLFALPIIALFAWLVEPAVSMEALKNAMPYVIMIGFLVFGVSKILWMEALHRVSITKISAMMALVPMMTMFFAYFFLAEAATVRQIFGIVPVLVGGYILTKPLT